LDWKLRGDPRIVVRENVNARYLTPDIVPDRCDLATFDVSFISVTKIFPAIPPLLQPEAELVILVKPQFEVGREDVGRGGIVRDPALHEQACRKVAAAVAELGYKAEWMGSPILGAEGNREFLLHGRR
ncbi:MAG TPA: SAM-dependent methyltransferase, partial [Bryobacteraceae bacterium]|nr:SAM-dependent methyltransferase [Bryobacteraceae bacterium]